MKNVNPKSQSLLLVGYKLPTARIKVGISKGRNKQKPRVK